MKGSVRLVWFKFIMFFVCVGAVLVSGWAVEVARMFARRVGKERERLAGVGGVEELAGWPAVAVILPMKGVDEDTEGNVAALFSQAYTRFRLIFVVESAEDRAVGVIARIAEARHGEGPAVQTVVAGMATQRGQKVHNQLAAVAETTEADEVLVFMDADAHAAAYWLRELVKPLVESGPESDLGATTGFRFYIPAVPGKCGADAMVSVINAGVAALLGPGWRNMAWGGSMAIRREHFFSFGVQEAWQRALSDDYVLSYCVKSKAKRRVQFVQGCLVGSMADFSWAGFWEFAVRQYRITRICAPWVWVTAVGAACLYLGSMAYAVVFWGVSLMGGRADWPLLVLFLVIYLANVMRGYLLLRGGMVAFPGEAGKLRKIGFWYTWGYPGTILVNLCALLRAGVGRVIVWRGVRYRMQSLLETRVERGGEGSASDTLTGVSPMQRV